MGYEIDKNDPDPLDDYDLSNDIFCPNKRCGCPDVEILKYPVPGAWWGEGKATCNHCGCTFQITIEEEAGNNEQE